MSFNPQPMRGKIGITGTLVYKNAAGEVIKKVEMSGAVPLSKLGLTEAQARAIVQQQQQEKTR